MGDKLRKFELIEPVMAPDARAARMAVATPLFPKEVFAGDWDVVLQAILTAWRARVWVLVSKGYIPVKYRWVAANCTPATFLTRVVSGVQRDDWFCHYRDVCPWCYMRWVSGAHRSIGELTGRTEGGRLLRMMRTVNLSYGAGTAGLTGALDALQREARMALRANLAGPTLPGAAVGGVWAVMVDPAVVRKDGKAATKGTKGTPFWRLRARVMLVVPGGDPVVGTLRNWDPPQVLGAPGSEEFTEVLAGHFRYPAGLVRGNPARAAECLQVRKEYPGYLAGTVGRLRGAATGEG
ncbi:MAG: hypothetical protein JWO38_285 [Gemmataceae bacterium]|nr:hypothetical protein [Gemmataceae bacterium]